LKKFEFRGIFNAKTFPHTDGFTEFISKQRSHLSHLVIKPQARQLSINSSDTSYSFWVNEDNIELQSVGLHSLSHLVLPKLKVLNIGLRDIHPPWPHGPSATYEIRNQPLLPNLSRVTPKLKKLAITDLSLSYLRVLSLVKSLQHEGVCALEELKFICNFLSPHIFDLLSEHLPRLKSLTVQFTYTASEPDSQFMDCHGFGDVGCVKDFHDLMRARRYSGWGLRYLRLVNPAPCLAMHPNLVIMKDVAESLSSEVVLDTAFTCHCVTNPISVIKCSFGGWG
jgi:hypothetical protein